MLLIGAFLNKPWFCPKEKRDMIQENHLIFKQIFIPLGPGGPPGPGTSDLPGYPLSPGFPGSPSNPVGPGIPLIPKTEVLFFKKEQFATVNSC